MPGIKNIEKLKSALVLLPPQGEILYNFESSELTPFLREPEAAALQPPAQGIQITSVRDQIVIQLGPKIVFEDRSDAYPPETSRLPDVVDGFIALFKRQGIDGFRAYGWNFDVLFDAPGEDSAARFIAENFLDTSTFRQRAQISPIGAGVNLFFNQSEARCQLQLEPRLLDLNTPRFYAHINYHYDLTETGGALPDSEGLRVAYHGLWASYRELLAKLVRA